MKISVPRFTESAELNVDEVKTIEATSGVPLLHAPKTSSATTAMIMLNLRMKLGGKGRDGLFLDT